MKLKMWKACGPACSPLRQAFTYHGVCQVFLVLFQKATLQYLLLKHALCIPNLPSSIAQQQQYTMVYQLIALSEKACLR